MEYAWRAGDDTVCAIQRGLFPGRRPEVPCRAEDAVDICSGLVSRAKIDEVLDNGFEAVQMARALLNEPGFVNRMRKEENARCSCRHSNYCIARMYSIEMACHQHLQEELPACLKKEIEKIEAKG